ncbi:MAG TPA: hypothetical protein VEC36_09010 [Patescibacteria group bacterium]|nr:hypothetical protein [Patescibacteria group bacterium]
MKLIFTVIAIWLCAIASAFSQTTYLFVGTYTGGEPHKGIYVYKFNPQTGKLI